MIRSSCNTTRPQVRILQSRLPQASRPSAWARRAQQALDVSSKAEHGRTSGPPGQPPERRLAVGEPDSEGKGMNPSWFVQIWQWGVKWIKQILAIGIVGAVWAIFKGVWAVCSQWTGLLRDVAKIGCDLSEHKDDTKSEFASLKADMNSKFAKAEDKTERLIVVVAVGVGVGVTSLILGGRGGRANQ